MTWNANLGHGHPRMRRALAAAAERGLLAYPTSVFPDKARAGQLLVDVAPRGMAKSFICLSGAEANENAVKMARLFTGRKKIVARTRSYHGATLAMLSLSGDPRREQFEPGLPGVARMADPYCFRCPFGKQPSSCHHECAEDLETALEREGPETVAAVILEGVVGANGVFVPPAGYWKKIRAICDRHGVLLIADEVLSGFGRTGRWFAVDHWDTVPDLMTMAKGLTSSYLPLGAVAMRDTIAEAMEGRMFYGGLTYSSHPVSLAAALATIGVYEEDDLIGNAARLDGVMRGHHEALATKHPSVGAHRNLGLFGILELVRSHEPWTPMTAFNGTSDEMKAVGKFLRDNGLYTMISNNAIHTNPPLCITAEQLAEGFDIIDRALDIADQAASG
jgi:taurine--2-oxoglutarate transaminase